jgi:sugar (pentulose or hexulose) kinase
VITVSVRDTANLGNILLCGHALNLYPSYHSALDRMVTTGIRIHYPDGIPVYDRQYSIFLDLYNQLKPSFKQMAMQ